MNNAASTGNVFGKGRVFAAGKFQTALLAPAARVLDGLKLSAAGIEHQGCQLDYHSRLLFSFRSNRHEIGAHLASTSVRLSDRPAV